MILCALQSYTGGVPAQVAQMIQRQVSLPAPLTKDVLLLQAAVHWLGIPSALSTNPPTLLPPRRWQS